MIYWKFYIGDWSKATVHLSACEVGVYVRLLNYYYEKECPLPPEQEKLFRIAGCSGRPEQSAVRKVLTEFFVEHPDGWYHDRANEEIAKAHIKSETMASASASRWARQRSAAKVR